MIYPVMLFFYNKGDSLAKIQIRLNHYSRITDACCSQSTLFWERKPKEHPVNFFCAISEIGSTFWCQIPFSGIQGRCLQSHGEVPLILLPSECSGFCSHTPKPFQACLCPPTHLHLHAFWDHPPPPVNPVYPSNSCAAWQILFASNFKLAPHHSLYQ